MTALLAVSLSLAVLQASGVAQHSNLPWVHPSSVMNAQIRPLPADEMDPAVYFGPMPYRFPSRLPPAMPFPVPDDQPLFRNDFPDDISQIEPLYNHEPFLDPDLQEFRQNVEQECNPRLWSNRRSCSDPNTVRTCTLSGTYRYTPCPQSWRCAQGLGICLRPFPLQLAPHRTFTCPGTPGTYPDPHSCKVYHVCTGGAGSTPETANCNWPQVYDPITQSCQMDTPETPCLKIKCFGGQSAVAYPGDPRIYVNCTRPGIVGSVGRCDNNAYNETSRQCDVEHYCIREGNIPGPQPNQYYTCSRVFKKVIRSQLKTCLGDLQFNSTTGSCAFPTPLLRSDVTELTGDNATLDDWTTEEQLKALQESVFILKKEDDPHVDTQVRAKRQKRSPRNRALLAYFNRETAGAEKSKDDFRLQHDAVAFVM